VALPPLRLGSWRLSQSTLSTLSANSRNYPQISAIIRTFCHGLLPARRRLGLRQSSGAFPSRADGCQCPENGASHNARSGGAGCPDSRHSDPTLPPLAPLVTRHYYGYVKELPVLRSFSAGGTRNWLSAVGDSDGPSGSDPGTRLVPMSKNNPNLAPRDPASAKTDVPLSRRSAAKADPPYPTRFTLSTFLFIL
jgi:hypothetical protein